MPNGDPWTNIFIRFKQNVDEQVAAAFQGAFGLPTLVSKNINSQWPEMPSQELKRDEANARDHETVPLSSGRTASSLPVSGGQPEGSVHTIFSSLAPLSALLGVEAFTDSLYQALWISFILDSSYSPLRLKDLPQPTPRDIPEGVDPSLFGFEDAFEDLLSFTSGQGLVDIHDRCKVKQEWHQSFPTGLPPILWLHQLCRQGLWDGWEARPDVLEESISERWRRWLEEQDDPFHQRPSSPSSTAQSDDALHANAPKAKTTVHMLSHDSTKPEQTEEDMYNALTPTDQRRSIEEHMGEIMKAFMGVEGRGSRAASKLDDKPVDGWDKSSNSNERQLPVGWKVEEKIQERKDANGNRTTSRTRITVNEKGEEVGRETETRSEWSWSSREGSAFAEMQDASARTERLDDKNGWFWK